MSRLHISKVLLLFIIFFHINSSITSPHIGIRDNRPSLKAFINAEIIISPEKKIDKGMLLIEDGKIISVTSENNPPSYARVYDLNGFTIYPGFIDPYTSYGLKDVPRQRRDRNYLQWEPIGVGASYKNDAVHASEKWALEFQASDKESKEYLSNGFTVVQSGKMDGIFRGQAFVTLLGEDSDDNELILNSSSAHFCSFNKGSSNQEYPQSLQGAIALTRQVFYDTDWYKRANEIFNNNKTATLKPEFNRDLEALTDYKNRLFIYDCNSPLNIMQAEKISHEFDLDFIEVGSGLEYNYLKELKEYGTTLILPLDFPKLPEIKTYYDRMDVSLSDLRKYELAPYNPNYLYQKEINFAFTTDKLKDKSIFLKNLRKSVKHGLPTDAALKALTVTPAYICGVEDICGTLENGKLANFVVTNGDIFDDKVNIYQVWVAGNCHEFKQIDNNPLDNFGREFILSYKANSDTLILNSKDSKYSGELIRATDTLMISDIKTLGNSISFNLTEKDSSFEYVTSFTGRSRFGYLDDINVDTSILFIDGSAIDHKGETFQFTAESFKTEDSLTESKEINALEDNIEIDSTLPRLAFPNKAYGFFEKPKMQNVLIKNITLWTSTDEGIIEDCDIIVKDGKIDRIGTALEAPLGYLTIDGTGKHMTAGIIDAHSHIAIDGDVNECTHAITSEVRIGDVVDPEDINIYRQLAGGVTSSMLIHGSCNPIGGQAQLIKLRWGEDQEKLKFEDSKPVIKFALGENVKRSGWGNQNNTRYPQSRLGVETIIHDIFDAAVEYEQEWNDYYALNKDEKKRTIPPRKDLTLDAVLNTIRSNYDIHCHAYVHTEMLMLMRLAEQFGFKVHLFIHVLEGYKIADELAKHGAGATGFSDWWAYKFEVYDAIPYNSALMAEKGVLTSVNSDNADLARRLNLEAAKAIEYGDMAPEEAIKLVTLNPAIQLNVADRVGSIEIGKDADFVIWNGDPLSIYSIVEQTWIEGKKYFDLETDKQAQIDIQNEKNRFIQKYIQKDGQPNMRGKRR